METQNSVVERASLRILEAASLARVSRRTIYHWMAAGKIDYCRTAGGAVRVYTDSLFKAPTAPLNAGTGPSTQSAQ